MSTITTNITSCTNTISTNVPTANTSSNIYKITTVENNTPNQILTKFHTLDGTIYQIIRDIDFMVNIKPCKHNQTFCIRLFKSEGLSNNFIGDFYFNIPDEIFIPKDEYPYPQLFATLNDTNNRIKYNMRVTLANYTDENSNKNFDKNFYIVHPCLEISKN